VASGKTLTIAIMDAPYESANSTTALRIIHSALEKGHKWMTRSRETFSHAFP